MLTLNLNFLSTISLCIIFFLIGYFLKIKIQIFNKFCIPAPVIGGLLFTLLTLFFRLSNTISINVLNNITPFFMNMFFTILGLNASFKLVKKGGSLLFKYWILCGGLALCQNIISIIMAKITNVHPLIGLMCGTISMEGGHGNAAAFGSTIENMGINNAVTIGLSAATLGIVLGGILGAPVSRYLILKYQLKPSFKNFLPSNFKSNLINKTYLTRFSKSQNYNIIIFLQQILVIFLCINLGEFITTIIYIKTSIVIPSVVCCMLISCLFRNLNDHFNILIFEFKLLDFLSEISLSMFLMLALMGINLLDLVHIAGPMLIIILAQVIFVLIYSTVVCFKVLGKNFDAAVMVAGLIGHGLGNTPNALANMNSITHKYGSSEKALLIVPLVGAFLLDIFTLPLIILFINMFK
ncbi:MAG: sodium/glutamate symporter [Romboutsia sp.]